MVVQRVVAVQHHHDSTSRTRVLRLLLLLLLLLRVMCVRVQRHLRTRMEVVVVVVLIYHQLHLMRMALCTIRRTVERRRRLPRRNTRGSRHRSSNNTNNNTNNKPKKLRLGRHYHHLRRMRTSLGRRGFCSGRAMTMEAMEMAWMMRSRRACWVRVSLRC